VGENSAQVILRDIFETPEPKPEVEKIIDTAVHEIKITETKIIKEKVIVRGYVNLQVIYVAALADQPVHAMHRRLDFSTFIVVPGAKEGMDVDIRPLVEYITADKENCHVIVELVLKITAKVTELLQRDVVVAVAPPVTPPPVCPPGQVITYTIKSGDTFFLLAQRFNVGVAAIQQANPGVNPNQLTIGQVINIPCPPAKG
ncbi:MAG TPA: peptidoglycan-binding protein, partial [Desulfotomaculum sp.]|nr:peptidoglycan-binding protein [Desulfotomaculum sp.]